MFRSVHLKKLFILGQQFFAPHKKVTIGQIHFVGTSADEILPTSNSFQNFIVQQNYKRVNWCTSLVRIRLKQTTDGFKKLLKGVIFHPK